MRISKESAPEMSNEIEPHKHVHHADFINIINSFKITHIEPFLIETFKFYYF